MVKEKQKKTRAKPSSKPSPPPKRQTRSQAADNPATDQTTFTNRQNSISAPQAIKSTAKAAEKKSAASNTKARSASQPTRDEKPAESDEPQLAQNRKRKAGLKEHDEDPKVSKKKQKLAKDNDQAGNHRKTGSRGDVQNSDRSKSAATNPLLSTLNAATAQGERDLKATKRSYIRQIEGDSSAVPSHDGRFTTFPSEPPRWDQNDSAKKRQAYQDELQKLELEMRTRDSLARKSQQKTLRDERSDSGETGSAETAAKLSQHLSSTADGEISHDDAAASQPPNLSSTIGEVDTRPAEPVTTDDTSIRQAPEIRTIPVSNEPYLATLDMNPESALAHLDALIETLVTKIFAAQSPPISSLICINPSRELEKLYQLVFEKDWKSAARHLHEQASLPAASLLRSLIWACLLKNVLNSQLDVPWPSPHRTATLLESFFPQPDEEITSLQSALRTISLRFMKTDKFLHSDLPLHTHSLVHTLYFSLIEHVHRIGGNWKGKELWGICEAALLFKGICKAQEVKVKVLWVGSGEGFDGEKMIREHGGKEGEREEVKIAFTLRPGLAVCDRDTGVQRCLALARVVVVSEIEK